MMRYVAEPLRRAREGSATLLGRAQAALLEKILWTRIHEPSTLLFSSERKVIGPRWMHYLTTKGVDQFTLISTHVDGLGATGFVGTLATPRRLRPAERTMYQQVHAHIQAGRFVLAHANPHRGRDPWGLTGMETRVVALAIRGYADKLIGYHLGIAPGTVSTHLASAMGKLGVERRVNLVRLLGPLFPGGRVDEEGGAEDG